MASLITFDYFAGEIYIAQLGQKTVQDKMTLFINKRERDYLLAIMGYEFFKEANTGMSAAEPEAKWSELKSGAEYTDEYGILQKWTGFSNIEKISPVANYVYFWYSRDNASKTTVIGEVQDTKTITINVAPAFKQMRAWNEMVEMNLSLVDFLINKKDEDGNRVYSTFDYDKLRCNKDFVNVTSKISLI